MFSSPVLAVLANSSILKMEADRTFLLEYTAPYPRI
jgi:hypothetical protein